MDAEKIREMKVDPAIVSDRPTDKDEKIFYWNNYEILAAQVFASGKFKPELFAGLGVVVGIRDGFELEDIGRAVVAGNDHTRRHIGEDRENVGYSFTAELLEKVVVFHPVEEVLSSEQLIVLQ